MGRKDYNEDVVTIVNKSPEYRYESIWGENFINDEGVTPAVDFVGRIVFNKTKNVTGVLRVLGSGYTPHGHGEPSFAFTNYGLVTKDYDISRLHDKDIVQFV